MFRIIKLFYNMQLMRAYVKNQWLRGIEIGEKALAQFPEDIAVRLTVAECYLFVEEPEKAFCLASGILEGDDTNIDALWIVVKSLFDLQRHDELYSFACDILRRISDFRRPELELLASISESPGALQRTRRKLADMTERAIEKHCDERDLQKWVVEYKAWYDAEHPKPPEEIESDE